jgi:hypothetical protein
VDTIKSGHIVKMCVGLHLCQFDKPKKIFMLIVSRYHDKLVSLSLRP